MDLLPANPVLSGRGREIRTPDILLPKQARYQTALYPGFHTLFPGAETATLPSPQMIRATPIRVNRVIAGGAIRFRPASLGQ